MSTVSQRKFSSVRQWILSGCKSRLPPLVAEWNDNSLSVKLTGALFLSRMRDGLPEHALPLRLRLPVHVTSSGLQKLCIGFNESVHNRLLCRLRKQSPSVHILLKINGFFKKKKKKSLIFPYFLPQILNFRPFEGPHNLSINSFLSCFQTTALTMQLSLTSESLPMDVSEESEVTLAVEEGILLKSSILHPHI